MEQAALTNPGRQILGFGIDCRSGSAVASSAKQRYVVQANHQRLQEAGEQAR